MRHFNYTLIGIIACLLCTLNLRSQILLPKSNEKASLTSLFGSNRQSRPCDRFYLQFVQVCEGQKFRVVDSFYMKAGTYVNITRAFDGCDSIITTILNLISSQRIDTTASLCFGKCFKVGTNCYTQSGNYTDTLKTRFGCDSIIRLNLTVSKPDSMEQNAVICDGQSFRVSNRLYFASGNFRDTISQTGGCSKIIKTNLTVSSKITTTQNLSICENSSIIVSILITERVLIWILYPRVRVVTASLQPS
jgi:hypothetical protein